MSIWQIQLDRLKSGIKYGTEVTLKLSSNVVGDYNDDNRFPHKLLLTNTQVSKFLKAFANLPSENIKTQLFNIVLLEGSIFYLTDVFNLPTKGLISLVYILVDTRLNIIGKKIKKETLSITRSRITLSNTEIKAIIKVTKSLENRRILLKGPTRKSTGEEGGILHFLRTLIKAGLPLIKIVLSPLAKTILTPLGLTAAASATDAAVHKKMFGSGFPLDLSSRMTTMIISNKEMNDIMKQLSHLNNLVY